MAKPIAVSLKNVSKTFYVNRGKGRTIRESVLGFFLNRKSQEKVVEALQNISLEVKKGEVFGIIGSNGSGKSTLIHLIMGSMLPNKGSILRTEGTLIRLSLGMGIDPNLSARDNIYVNGSILGLSFKQIGLIFHDILAFANLEDFVDVPVKLYSKGMQARLKFSIAMYANADIFLLDEFFGGVGDQDFRKKSDEAFKQRILEGKTIIIVSHSMGIIKKYCNRVLWINKGVPEMIGEADEVIRKYKESFDRKNPKFKNKRNQKKNNKGLSAKSTS